jgi:hypothetical protein
MGIGARSPQRWAEQSHLSYTHQGMKEVRQDWVTLKLLLLLLLLLLLHTVSLT